MVYVVTHYIIQYKEGGASPTSMLHLNYGKT